MTVVLTRDLELVYRAVSLYIFFLYACLEGCVTFLDSIIVKLLIVHLSFLSCFNYLRVKNFFFFGYWECAFEIDIVFEPQERDWLLGKEKAREKRIALPEILLFHGIVPRGCLVAFIFPENALNDLICRPFDFLVLESNFDLFFPSFNLGHKRLIWYLSYWGPKHKQKQSLYITSKSQGGWSKQTIYYDHN